VKKEEREKSMIEEKGKGQPRSLEKKKNLRGEEEKTL